MVFILSVRHKSFIAQFLLHFKREFLKTVYACFFTNRDLHITTKFDPTILQGFVALFDLEYDQRVSFI